MRLLLDTHVALWLASDPGRLADAALELVNDPRSELLFSSVSAWEISIKYTAKKLLLPAPPKEFLPEFQRRLKLTALPIDTAQAVRAGELPMVHRDPFDRMLVAQAQTLDVAIMTVDPIMGRYDVKTVSA